MNLAELHQRLARKPTYCKAYDAIGSVVLIGAAIRKLREDSEITQAALAEELDVSLFYLSRLENGSGKVPPTVVAATVRRFEKQLRQLGIVVEPWLATAAPKPRSPLSPTARYASRPNVIPETVSRPRPTGVTHKPVSLVHEKPSHKYGKSH